MKFLFTLSLTILSLPSISWAQESVYAPLVDLSNAGQGSQVQTFEQYINFLYGMSIAVAALLAVIKIVIAGAKYMLSDVISNKGEALKDIQGAILGLLLILSAVIILELINPQLTDKSISFPEFQCPEGKTQRECRGELHAPAVTASNAQQEAICSQYTGSNLRTIPREEGKLCHNILGTGWAHVPECCSTSDPASMCCGFSESNGSSSTPPNIGTGDFKLEVVIRDTLNECHEDSENLYETLEICATQQTRALADNNMAVTVNCEGETVNSPRSRYDTITNLPVCGANPAPGSYGDVSPAYTYSERMTRFDAVNQAAQFRNRCESQFGTYSIRNGPTGSFANATATCRVPTVITYSGNKSRGSSADSADCAAQRGKFDYNLFTASYCVIRR